MTAQQATDQFINGTWSKTRFLKELYKIACHLEMKLTTSKKGYK